MHYTGLQASAITWSFTGLMLICFLLRVYTRFGLVRNPGWEDYTIIFAALNCLGLSICIQIQINNGLGEHTYTLSPDTMTRSLKAFYGSLMVYYLSLTFTKISILLQYLRIFPQKYFRVAAYAVMGLVIVYGLWTFFSSIFLCWPIAFFWDLTIEGGRCLNEYAVWFTNAGINIATDFIIVALPLHSIRHLNLPKRQKRLLGLVFGLAGFVCIVSILRLQSLVTISNSTDPTYDNGPAATWSSIEANVGITCACLPPLRPLISRIAPSFFHTSNRTSTYHSNRPYAYGSRRGDPMAGDHIPLSSNAKVGGDATFAKSERSANRNSTSGSEEEMVGFTDMIGNGGVKSTVVASKHVFENNDQRSPNRVPSFHGQSNGHLDPHALPIQRPPPVMAPTLPRERNNSFGMWEVQAPQGNEIQVVTSMQQSVEVQPASRRLSLVEPGTAISSPPLPANRGQTDEDFTMWAR